MRGTFLITMAVLTLTLVSLGHTEESVGQTSSDDKSESVQSRTKRAGRVMGRVIRGLHMLRLGKRDGAPLSEDPGDIEDVLNMIEAYQEENPEFYLSGDDRALSEDELEAPEHHRSRRSTENPGAAPLEARQSQSFKDSGEHELKVEEAEPYFYFPEEGGDFYEGDVAELLEGGNEDGSAEKRQVPMLRLGKRSLSMLRLGKREDDEADFDEEKRSLSMLRLGKREDDSYEDSFDEENDKRSLSMLRLGKRPMSMLRLGKRPMSMLRLGKRPMSMLRLGKRPMSMLRLGKRPMSMLRLGKRPMSMLRLGKRPMSMLRLGKRPMSMLRLGKRPMSMLRLGKRPMSMLRLGKRPMSMLRLGKREDDETTISKRSVD